MEKEQGQVDILEGYLGRIEVVGEEEIREIVKEVGGGEAKVGMVVGKVMAKVKGRPVDAEMVKRVVGEVLGKE